MEEATKSAESPRSDDSKTSEKTPKSTKTAKSPKTRKLTAKQREFVSAYLQTNNASEAIRQAYPSATPGTQRSMGATNIAKPSIQAAIEEKLQEKDLTDKRVIEGIAEETKDENAFIRLKAWELIGKWRKMFTDKIDHTHALEHVDRIRWGTADDPYEEEEKK